MLKLLFAFGLLFGPLYRLFSGAQNKAPQGGSAPSALLNFAPRFTMITRVDVPVNSRNAAPMAEVGSAERSAMQSKRNGKIGTSHSLKGHRVAAANSASAKLGAVKKAFLNSLS